MSVEELVRAGQILACGGDSAEVRRVSEFLEQVKDRAETWQMCLSLLQPSTSADLSLLCAVLLYEKTRRELNGMDIEKRLELKAYLGGLISAGFPRGTAKKLCQCYTLVGLAVSSAFIEEVLTLDPEMAFEVLSCVPTLLAEYRFPDSTKREFSQQLSLHSQRLLDLLAAALLHPSQCLPAAEVLKDWSQMQLPVLQHLGLVQALLT